MFAVRASLLPVVAAFALGLVLFPVPSRADIDANTTSLPSYPHLHRGIMDRVARITLGQQCIHYTAESSDSLEKTEAWYRKALPDAVETDVNDNSVYGSYFRLTGIRLTRGHDFLMVYRTPDAVSTSIELFQCRAPAPAK